MLFEILMFVFFYFFSRLPIRDFDIWFHLKNGELFVQNNKLIFQEVFSHSAQGRELVPYEWLFQVIIYYLGRIDIKILPYFIGLFVLLNIYFLRKILLLFHVAFPTRIFLLFLFFFSSYEFNTIRPHVLAYSFLSAVLFCIISFVKSNSRWLYFTPLVTLIWANLHSSAFLSWGMMLSFTVVLALQKVFTKTTTGDQKIKKLLFFSLLNFIMTVLPPLGFRDYKLLWDFFQNRVFLGNFIAEWGPPQQENPFGYTLYLVICVISLLSFLVPLFYKKTASSLTLLPFVVMGLSGLLATRNVILGIYGLVIIFGANISLLKNHLGPKFKVIYYLLLVFTFIFLWRLLFIKQYEVNNIRLYFPVQATEFAKLNLKGKMFNDYSYGGYILYHAYPKLQVFIDGRADVYLCCEMRDYLMLAGNKNLPDKEYKKFLDEFFHKYGFSFAIISPQKHNIFRRIAKLLNNNPKWVLVFWDDDSQVFVKRDGLNNDVIKLLEAKYATPYLRDPFPKDKIETSLYEYERMDKIAKSARTSNALGYIYLLQSDVKKAKEKFFEAVSLDPFFESPFMNLAEIAVLEKNLQEAISLYQKAQKLAPDRGLVYLRLGQIVWEKTGSRNKAEVIWKEGLKNTIDQEAKKEIQRALESR